MNNLLEKASIITTPTGYSVGAINSIVPNTADGDFDFTRNSSATRVNSQGLIEDVQKASTVELVDNGDFSELGSELIINGNFATDSDWTLTQATISEGSLNFSTTNGSFAGAREFNAFTVGKIFILGWLMALLIPLR
jgi:hypothetical protein